MFKELMMASYGYYGGIGDVLATWEQYGFFSYLLPFLLIFALVFGILTQVKLFKEYNAVNGIIALVVGLMALQFDFVPIFFSEIFPRLGIGLAIILIVFILIGLFADPDSGAVMWTMLSVGAIIVIVILIQTAGAVGWNAGYWWYDNWPIVAGAVFILIVLGVIIGSANKDKHPNKSILSELLRKGGR